MRRLVQSLGILGVAAASAVLAEEYSEAEVRELAEDHGVSVSALMMEGDVEYGEYLGGECTTCHQSDGDHDGIPAIIYLDDVFFKIALHEYKSKQREHPVMQMIAAQLGDEEIAALAAYFSQVEEH